MSLLDWLFPRRCVGCGWEGGYFCAECLNKVVLAKESVFQKDSSLENLTSVFAYRGLIKKAIKRLKYRFVTDISSELVELFLSFIGEQRSFTQYCSKRPILTPIPLHKKRLNWRGFNQSELLGKRIAQNLDLPFVPNLLIRIKET
ncbi:MAG: double zinc ribbon domain-containing protein, partial [Candidatus Shapirobacteria bacterium]